MNTKLQISGLTFSYEERKILNEMDFRVKEGEFVSLLGPSGCGKSTLLKLLTGVIKPEAGRILVDGEEIHGITEHFAYMPQNEYPSALSGGMRQRAAFLRTLLCHADILLLDEPFGALDVITRGEMQDWLLSVREKMNRTVLLVTHDIDEAIYLSDRILVLDRNTGKIGSEMVITEQNRSRDWLYSQGELRQKIYRQIMGEKTEV